MLRRLLDSLSIRRQRQLQGCYYLGCFTPLAFTILAGMILIKAMRDWLGRVGPHGLL